MRNSIISRQPGELRPHSNVILSGAGVSEANSGAVEGSLPLHNTVEFRLPEAGSREPKAGITKVH